MLAALMADIKAKVETVTVLAQATSLSIGGRSVDPGLLLIPLPAAWIVFKNDQVDEEQYQHGPSSGLVPRSQVVMATIAVTVFIEYLDDADLLANQFPLLERVAEAVHATEISAAPAYRWRYIGQKIALVYPDRLAYEQRFTVDYVTGSE